MAGKREFQLGDKVAATYNGDRVKVGTITRIKEYTHATLISVTDSDDHTLVFRLPEIKLIKEAASDESND